jgi:hypothetical protein
MGGMARTGADAGSSSSIAETAAARRITWR